MSQHVTVLLVCLNIRYHKLTLNTKFMIISSQSQALEIGCSHTCR